MVLRLRLGTVRRLVFIALPLALLIALFSPGIVSAHAILLRSDPARDAVLRASPQQVRMWFTEDLNPTFSTAAVINATSQRVDRRDAHISLSDTKEMDVTLAPNLPPGVYVVLYRTDSADDGHILRGSFIFSVADANGNVPRVQGVLPSGQDILGASTSGAAAGQLDGPGLFSVVMITLVELCAVFWAGAQFWRVFVLQLVPEEDTELQTIGRRVQRRFDVNFAIPTLLVLLIADVGVLVAQALTITNGQWLAAFAPNLLFGLVSSGRFGTFWLAREFVTIAALLLAFVILITKRRPHVLDEICSWANLLLALGLFTAISMSSHASAVGSNIVTLAVLADWLHLLAASLWVGGMLYLAAIYLPVLYTYPLGERTRALITILPRFSPLAIVGVVIMSVSGPFSATVHLNGWQDLLLTAYGRALSVKSLLVGCLLLTSAIHVILLRPALVKAYKKYAYALKGVSFNQAGQVKLRERNVRSQTGRLMSVLRWEPLLGVAILVCVGLMNVFAGTLTPAALGPQPQQATSNAGPFNTTLLTTDKKYRVQLNVNPNRFGSNVFTVTVIDAKTGKPTTNVGVTVYTTMLDMDMGTEPTDLQADGKGHFSATADLGMAGHWQIRVLVRTPDTVLHETTIDIDTPF